MNRTRPHSKLRWFVALAAVAYATSPAGAQTTGGNAGNGSQASARLQGGSQPGQAGSHVGFQRHVQLTPEQQLAEADDALRYAAQSSQVVGRRLQQARQQRDVVKALCLNDRLSQIDVAGRSLQERKSSLASAAGRHDTELSNHEYTILTVLRERVEQLMTEANQCIGTDTAVEGATTVSLEVDPDLPPPDESGAPPEPVTIWGPLPIPTPIFMGGPSPYL